MNLLHSKKIIRENRKVSALIGVSFIFFLANMGLIYFNIGNISNPLIFNFSPIEGSRITGTITDLWKILLLEGVFLFANYCLGIYLFYRERVLTYLILSFNVLLSILAILVTANIISFN